MSVEILLALVSAVSILIGGYWALVKIIVGQFEKRLAERLQAMVEISTEGRTQYEQRFVRLEGEQHKLDRAHMRLLAELPREYVRREDHIRFETVINAKLDALYSEMRLLAERAQVRT